MCDCPKISVIVPFYNGDEKMLVECINSILRQTFADFELIIVNDGSEERYNSILNAVSAMDCRISILNEINGGASVARNTGVEFSKGDYIAFVDSDDIVHTQYLEQAYEIITRNDVDLVIGSIVNMSSDRADYAKLNSQKLWTSNSYKIYNKTDFTDLIPCFIAANRIIRFPNGGHLNRGPVARLIKANIAKSVFFPEGIEIGEDLVWNQEILKKSNCIAIAENIWYYYLMHEDSSVYRYKKNSIEIVRQAGLSLYESISYVTNDDIYRAFCTRILDQTRQTVCMAYLTNKANKDSFWKKIRAFLAIKKDYPWKYITWRYVKVGNARERFIYFLYWSNLYFLLAYLKDFRR